MEINHLFIFPITVWSFLVYPTLSVLTVGSTASDKIATARVSNGGTFAEGVEDFAREDKFLSNPCFDSQQSLHGESEITEIPSEATNPQPISSRKMGKEDKKSNTKPLQKEKSQIAAEEILKACNKVNQQIFRSSPISYLKEFFTRIWKKATGFDAKLLEKIAFVLREEPSWLQDWAQDVAEDVARLQGLDTGPSLGLTQSKKSEFDRAVRFIKKYKPELFADYKGIDHNKSLGKAKTDIKNPTFSSLQFS